MFTIKEIKEAGIRISPYINSTPMLTSSTLNKITGASLYFKCENFQKTGSFKFRGACNAIFALSPEQTQYGVATHSSGNHGAAVAYAAKLRGIKAYVVMPKTSSEIKKLAVNEYEGIITFCEPSLAARKATLDEIIHETGATLIHAYENEQVIYGQGTAALELLLESGDRDLDIIIAPIGGGGLLSGTAIAAKELSPRITVIGAEPETANDAYLSFKSKNLVSSPSSNSICDGLLTSLGKTAFSIILKNVDDIHLASEQSIISATRYIWERMKIIAEPSAAITLAIILEHAQYFKNKKIGLILSGGNVDIKQMANYF
ncbi:MAG: serine dehydratase [Gammaproteobacteria bacterium RIFCSPHIGHO2_12_FULL_37_14]|nr:MAG: serine dehydratase [Gammaproteobacteria bacterium RIFCSPHIGHO2_12_FULL_37_14]